MGVRDDKDIVHQLVQPLFKNNFNNYLFKLANLVCVFAWVCSGTCVWRSEDKVPKCVLFHKMRRWRLNSGLSAFSY